MKRKIVLSALQAGQAQNTLARAVSCAFAGMVVSTASWAQSTSSGATAVLEEVVITGTSIRGVAQPVGQNLITVGREEIEESGATTMQQLLSSVPAITGFGNAAQGAFGSADGAGTFAPTIHGLGASASNGTLVLIDGHRLPLSGINHTLVDPNVIAPLAIERVEVLPDGASATYGSDAVAGVLNFITRRNFQGFEVNGSYGFGDSYDTQDAGFILGDTWDRGSALLSYNYTRKSNIAGADRQDIIYPDHTSQGGGNFLSANCGVANIQAAAGSATLFPYPYTAGNTLSTATNNGNCNVSTYSDLLPETIRHNLLVKLTYDVNERLAVNADVVFSKLNNNQAQARGAISTAASAAFGPGNTATTQINPFYQVGTSGIGNSQFVRWQADDLLGPGAVNKAAAETFFVTSGAELKLGGDWLGTLGMTIGKDDSRLRQEGQLCTSCALLALNGTTNTAGSPTTPSLPGTTTAVLNTPLTTANALDVWNPAATNRTSAAVRGQLIDSTQLQLAHQTLNDVTLKFDGSLFSLPGGAVRAAVGAEYLKYAMSEEVTRPRNTGPVSSNSLTTFLELGRDVKSGFAEVLIPLVGEGNAIPGIAALDVNVAGRYDKYSDFGDTTNPKVAMTWTIVKGFQVRTSFGESFTAPALTSRGDANGTTAETNVGNLAGGTVTIPDSFPGVAALKALNLSTACSPTSVGCTTGGAVTGIQVNGGNKDLKPQTGKTFSVGFDWRPDSLPGLNLSGTYWSAEYQGAITAPQPVFAVNAPGLQYSMVLLPTPAQISEAISGKPLTVALPANIYYIYSFQQKNALNLKADGIDASIGYHFNTGVGNFSANLNWAEKLKMDQQVGSGGAWFSVLNTSGFNTTFPSLKRAVSLDLGWTLNQFNANLKLNYTGGYSNWSGTTGQGNPAWALISTNGVPSGGGQPIPSNTIANLHLGYNLAEEGMLKDMVVSVDVQNLMDEDPPFYNVANGYDTNAASPVGRVITVGLSKKW